MARGQELDSVLVMARRNAKPIDPMEMREQHGRCHWEGLREQDLLLQ
mgnify:CR=1